MPGSTLNLNYPVLGEPIATALGKIIAMFQAIQNDLQPKIIPAEFDWITDLSAKGHALTNLSLLSFINGNLGGAAAGSIAYDGTDFYFLTAAGSVRITNGGGLNFASTGGIVGDYVSSSAQVYYDSATNQYRFFNSASTYSDLVCDNVYLRAITGGGYVKLTADDTIASPQMWTLKALPGAGTSVLTIDSSGNVVQAASVSNAQTFTGAVTMSGGVTVSAANLSVGSGIALTGSADITHAVQWEVPQTPFSFLGAGGSWALTTGGELRSPGGAAQTVDVAITGIRVGDVFQQAKVRVYLQDAGTSHYAIYKIVDNVATRISNDITDSTADSAYHTITVSFAAPYTTVTNERYVLRWTPPPGANPNERLATFSVFVTR